MFGDELRKARQAVAMSQEQLGFSANIHRTYVSLLERNLKSPTLEVLFRICDALGVSAGELVSRVEQGRKRSKGSKR